MLIFAEIKKSIMDFLKLAQDRYSCKKYSDRPVPEEVLTQILEAGRLAPTAKNLQEHHIYVCRSSEALDMIDKITPCRYGAPVVLAVAFDKDNVYTTPDGSFQSGVEDATIVATHLMLAAASLGVDSCWINKFYPADLHRLMGLPANEQLLMLLDLGYAAEGAGPLPNHSMRKPLADTVTYL